MIEIEKPNCEYFRINLNICPEGKVKRDPVCTYSDEYHPKTDCEGKRGNCAYPEKWEKQ